jgi:hypothetical protein
MGGPSPVLSLSSAEVVWFKLRQREEAEQEGLCSDGEKYANCELLRLVDLLPRFNLAESVGRKQIRERDLED